MFVKTQMRFLELYSNLKIDLREDLESLKNVNIASCTWLIFEKFNQQVDDFFLLRKFPFHQIYWWNKLKNHRENHFSVWIFFDRLYKNLDPSQIVYSTSILTYWEFTKYVWQPSKFDFDWHDFKSISLHFGQNNFRDFRVTLSIVL